MSKYAILSVSDKNNLEYFARGLVELGFQILSTGGTSSYLNKHNIKTIDISTYTNFKEMFSGRVKTLHPKVFGGILYRRENIEDVDDVKNNSIFNIELVCVNLYPFKETTEKTDNFETIVENIDIGGPSLIRAAAKNFKSVIVVVNPDSYNLVLDHLKNKDNEKLLNLKQKLMLEAFNHTALYESYIANYMNNKFNEDQNLFITAKKVMQLNYGENPHQEGSLYEFNNFYSTYFKVLKGNISFNNLLDINAALKIATSFKELTATIVKHNNPCGFGLGANEIEALESALICDPISAYGGVIAINGVVNEALADKLLNNFFEVIIAVSFAQEALKKFESKKRLKLVTCSKDNKLFWNDELKDFKRIENGLLYQTKDKVLANEISKSILKTKKIATDSELKDLEIATQISALTKSNCIVFVKNSTLLAIGMGMTSRVDSIKAAIYKAKALNISLENSVMVSEAFFPFKDSIDLASSVGVSAILQPGGSIRDNEVIEACDKLNIAMYFSGFRHFLH